MKRCTNVQMYKCTNLFKDFAGKEGGIIVVTTSNLNLPKGVVVSGITVVVPGKYNLTFN